MTFFDSDDEFEQVLRRFNERLDRLNEQLEQADRILASLDRHDNDGFEREEIADSDDDEGSVATVDAVTGAINEFDCDDSDCETVAEDWNDPYRTPVRVYQHIHADIIIPDNLEDGLEFLDEL